MNRLLILDDSPRVADALRDNISDFDGYETEFVEVAYTSPTAIELARQMAENQQPFNVFLIDQNLGTPAIDGIQTMKELLAISPEADTIIFTGYETPQDGMRAYEEGASRYLPKPFEPKELAFILKDLFRSRNVRLEAARQKRQFKVAAKIAESVGASLDLENTMDAVLETLCEIFDKTKLCVLLYDEREKTLNFAPATLKYYEIKNPEFLQKTAFPLVGGSIACRVANKTLTTKEMICENVENVAEDPDYADLNPSTKSECCVGLLDSKNSLLGVMALERERINGFNNDDLDLIKMTAHHISIAIERAKQGEELEFNSAVAAQTSWAANIAHELNSEVGKIANWAYLIQKNAEEGSTIFEYARNIEESAYQLSSANPWSAQPPKIANIESSLKNHLDKMAPKKSVEVDLQLNAGNALVEIKPAQFQFLIKQLLNNAARAMMDMERKRVLVSTKLVDDKMVEIRFQDFGPGIKDENYVSVFHRSFTTKGTGGFGLLFVRKVIEDMHGKISLLPYQSGQGATFIIHFPITEQNNTGY